MEYSVFPNYLPIGTFNSPYYSYQEFNSPPGQGSSDNSMDSGIREPMKLKDVQDDLFSWTGERSSLGDDRNQQYSEQVCSDNDNCRQVKQEPCKNLSHDVSKAFKGLDFQGKSEAENYQDQMKYTKDEMLNKEKEGNQFDDKITKCGEVAESVTRAQMDVYLEKPQINISNNQMACDIVAEGGAALPRKRKLEGAWPGGKMRPINQQCGAFGKKIPDWSFCDIPDLLSSKPYDMNDQCMSLMFKEETPSPTNITREQPSPPRSTQWMGRQVDRMGIMNNGIVMNGNSCNTEQSSSISQTNGLVHNGIQQNNQMSMHNNNIQIANSQMSPVFVSSPMLYPNGMQDPLNASLLNNEPSVMEVASGLISSTTHSPLEQFPSPPMKTIAQSTADDSMDTRFQYILAAATSIATKCNEDTLTYLNQCQSYEIKFKKLGDLSNCKGKIFKSVIRICFHERRLQFSEREQMSLWQSERPGERIVEVDVPLSYGFIHVNQPTEQPLLNTVEIYWDPVKEVGVYIKINCISTEFTAKKHGGEKGVPFRIQVETFVPGEGPKGSNIIPSSNPPIPDKRLHVAACQIKVFKLKGADRKHKQDKEKVQRRPPSEREKYQRSYDCTIFTDLPNDAVFTPAFSSNQVYSPEHNASNIPTVRASVSSPNSPSHVDGVGHQLALHTQLVDAKHHNLSRADSHSSSLNCDDDNICKTTIQCNTENSAEICEFDPLPENATPMVTRSWLSNHRFTASIQVLGNFSGADILRLSRDDLIQICGIADGIRLFNALHIDRTPARLTIYVRKYTESQYTAVFLRNFHISELRRKLHPLLQDINGSSYTNISTMFLGGPNGIKIRLTDEVVQNFKPESLYYLEPVEGGIILRPSS